MALGLISPSKSLLSVLLRHTENSGSELGTPCHSYTLNPESATYLDHAIITVEVGTHFLPTLRLSAGDLANLVFTIQPRLASNVLKQPSCLRLRAIKYRYQTQPLASLHSPSKCYKRVTLP